MLITLGNVRALLRHWANFVAFRNVSPLQSARQMVFSHISLVVCSKIQYFSVIRYNVVRFFIFY